MILQSEIKKLQQTINKQLQSSPLSKKIIKATQFYDQINQKPKKVSAIMQTSSQAPQISNKKLKKTNQPKKQSQIHLNNQPSVPVKTQEQKKLQQKQFLISQNKSLKQQTLTLVQQLQNLLSDTKQKKYGINIDNEQEPKQIKLKKALIAQQVVRIAQIQNTIAYQKRQLKYVYDDQYVTSQQAKIKILQTELQKLQKQKKALLKIIKEQNKGIQEVSMTPEFRQKFQKTKQQLEKIKQQCKSLQIKTLQSQKLLKKRHQKTVGHQVKIKKIQKILKQKEDKKKKGIQNEKYVTLEMIAEIQNQIAQLQSQKIENQKTWATKILNVQTQLENRKLEEEKKLLILKQKQKQIRLNDLRVKELKKLIQNNLAEKRKASLSQDESKKQQSNHSQINQGRKRNIKFMQVKDRQISNVSNS